MLCEYSFFAAYVTDATVLILVLMEDALRESIAALDHYTLIGLNPCSNGRCSARAGNCSF